MRTKDQQGNSPDETRQSEDEYVFKRNRNATTRLNYQYYLWQDTYQFLLHPSIPCLKADARIADVATGSGIWLFDLSRKLPPTTVLYGIDISLDQIGPHASTIPNLQLQQWDFFKSPPTELLGTFDVVHMRLIAVIVKNNDPERILQNVKLLLKPGGYLQWEEHHPSNVQVYKRDEPATAAADTFPGTTRLRDLMVLPLHSTKGQKLLGPRDWIPQVPSLMSAQGFEQVQQIVYHDAPHMGMFFTDMYIDSAEEFAAQMLETDPELARELTVMAERVHEESRDGAWLSNPKAVFLGCWRGEQ